jgi:hypothetical protein
MGIGTKKERGGAKHHLSLFIFDTGDPYNKAIQILLKSPHQTD